MKLLTLVLAVLITPIYCQHTCVEITSTPICGCYLEPSIYEYDWGTAAFFLDNEFDTIGNASATDSSTGDVYYFNPCSSVSCSGTDATICRLSSSSQSYEAVTGSSYRYEYNDSAAVPLSIVAGDYTIYMACQYGLTTPQLQYQSNNTFIYYSNCACIGECGGKQ